MESLPESSEIWWSEKTIAVVTGANQGIGLQIVRELAKRGLTTVLTFRNEVNGRKSVDLLKSEGLLHVDYHQLDITDPDSVHRFAIWLAESYGSIDILVNNAGVCSFEPLNRSGAEAVLNTNYYGTKRVIEAITPLLRSDSTARIVNVSSKASDLQYLNHSDWKAKLEDTSSLTVDAIDCLLKEYLQAVEKGEVKWPCFGASMNRPLEVLSDYSISKMALNAYSRIVARDRSNTELSINMMCPGVTKTSMSKLVGHSVETGADTAVWLALLPRSQNPSGRFFMGRQEVGFSDMPVFFDGKLHRLKIGDMKFNV